jgi:hypothetical protein
MNTYSVLRVLSYIFLILGLIAAPFCIPTALALGMPQCNNTDVSVGASGHDARNSRIFPPYDHQRGCVNISTSTLEIVLISLVVLIFACLLIAILLRILMKYCCKPVYQEIVIATDSEEYFNPNYVITDPTKDTPQDSLQHSTYYVDSSVQNSGYGNSGYNNSGYPNNYTQNSYFLPNQRGNY